MALDPDVVAELKAVKAQIDGLQQRLKDLVERLRAAGATTQEITGALKE